VCHDILTLMPEYMRLSAPAPADCSGTLVVSPLTTLLVNAAGVSCA
jgi:hypothetical protein